MSPKGVVFPIGASQTERLIRDFLRRNEAFFVRHTSGPWGT
jgi:hypothetical protein